MNLENCFHIMSKKRQNQTDGDTYINNKMYLQKVRKSTLSVFDEKGCCISKFVKIKLCTKPPCR